MLGHSLPVWAIAPFAAMLLAIAILPLLAPRFWEHHHNKGIVSLVLGLPVVIWILCLDRTAVLHTLHEYVAFIILLGALFVISGGIVVRGRFKGSPGINTLILAVGGILASVIGTTGASVLLIRPLLRANHARERRAHVVIFFIFIVSNAGGLLTPLGDPPLFLGFLRGVPFFWTLHLLPEWAFVVGLLLAIFYLTDRVISRRERPISVPVPDGEAPAFGIGGGLNLVWLLGVAGTIVLCGYLKPPTGVQEAAMLLFAGLAYVTTRPEVRRENDFAWGPIIEVTVVFLGIFATMIPALAILNARGGELGLTEPWHFFWATGALSSFLDNAPTYLAFSAIASGLVGTNAQYLTELIAHDQGAVLLSAISLGAVLMGANTYIGNGPNFMVKAIAGADGVKMPSFFGYMLYSLVILMPTFVIVTLVFLR